MDFGPIFGGTTLLLVCGFYILHKRRKNRSVTKEYPTILEQYLKQQGSQVEGKTTTCSTLDEEGKIEKHAFPQELSSYSTRIDAEGGSRGRRLSSVTVSGSNANPLRAAAVTKVSDSVEQTIQIIESSALKDSKGSSAVKVVSVKPPCINEVSKRAATSQIQLARIEDIDTSRMKLIDRSILKLRKWKAFILAEVPPMVEVETHRVTESEPNPSCTNPVRREALIQRLAYAKKVGGDRSVIDSEAQSHSLSKRDKVSRRQRKKKEFLAVPPSTANTSFYKVRSNTTSV